MPVHNGLLRRIAEEFPGYNFDWRDIRRRLQETERFHRPGYNPDNDRGFLVELGVRGILEQLCEDWIAEGRVNLHPIESGHTVDGYEFVYRDDEWHIRHHGLDYEQPDLIFEVDGLLIVGEIKSGRYKVDIGSKEKRARRRKRRRGEPARQRHTGITDMMSQRTIDSRSAPFKAVTRTRSGKSDCGYVIITPPEHIRPELRAQRKFIRKSGLLIPLPHTRAECRTAETYFVRSFRYQHAG